jgi:hypothetical protein
MQYQLVKIDNLQIIQIFQLLQIMPISCIIELGAAMTQIHLSKAEKVKIAKKFSDSKGKDLKKHLPAELKIILEALIRQPSEDSDVIITTNKELVTPNEAAILLQMSRPMVMRLVKEGKLLSFQVGKHNKLNRKDVMEYKNSREKLSKENFKKLNSSLNALVQTEGWEE